MSPITPQSILQDEIIEHLAPLPTAPGPNKNTGDVWVAADGRTPSPAHPIFAETTLYAIYPAEVVDFSSDDAKVARRSAMLYANLTCTDFPQKPYETCVNAGWGGLTIFSALARVLPSAAEAATAAAGVAATDAAVTAADLADAFETYVAAYGANSTNFLA